MDRIAKAFSRNVEAGHASNVDAVALMENRLDAASTDLAVDRSLESIQ
jgi:hypothetical protein